MKPNSDLIDWKEIFNLKNIFLNFIGVSLIVLALQGFMIPNKFLDGGIIGISILLHEVTHCPFAYFVVVLNFPFLFLGYRLLGMTFALQSLLTFLIIALGMTLFNFSAITSDPLLIALFGGCLIGTGMGLCIRSGAVADGIEILALLATRRIGFNVSEVIFGLNSLLFLTAALVFGISTALYSIVTYFSAVKALDYVSHGVEHYTALHIISSKSEELKALIVKKYGKGITVLKGERGFLPDSFEKKEACDILVTIVTRLELLRLKEEIEILDPHAFTYIQFIKEAHGGILRHRHKH